MLTYSAALHPTGEQPTACNSEQRLCFTSILVVSMARFSKLCPGPKCSGQCRTPCYRSLSFFELHAPAGIDACAFVATACASVATACAPGATSGALSLHLCSLVCLLSIFVFSAVASAKSTFATVAAAAARPNGALTVVSTRQLAPAVIDGRIDASVSDLAGLRPGAGQGATALGRENLNLMGDMPIAHGGDTTTPGASAQRELMGSDEVWPAEAETLPQAARETMLGKLFGTLSLKVIGGQEKQEKSYFLGFARTMIKLVQSRKPAAKRPAETSAGTAAGSTVPGSKKSRDQEVRCGWRYTEIERERERYTEIDRDRQRLT